MKIVLVIEDASEGTIHVAMTADAPVDLDDRDANETVASRVAYDVAAFINHNYSEYSEDDGEETN